MSPIGFRIGYLENSSYKKRTTDAGMEAFVDFLA